MRTILTLLLLLSSSLAWAGSPAVENHWRIEVSGNAQSAGELVIAVAAKNAPATNVTVAVADNTSENDVAALVANALAMKLFTTYKVEHEDGEDIVLKARMGEPKFSVVLVSNTIEGVRIGLDEE